MNFQRKIIAVALLAVMVASQACDSNKIREARKAAFRIQVVTDAAVDSTGVLFDKKVLSKEQTLTIAKALLKINHANRFLIERAANMTEDTPGNRAALFTTVREISAAVKELKDLGVITIRNPDGSLAFDSAVAALDVALAAIEAALSGGG